MCSHHIHGRLPDVSQTSPRRLPVVSQSSPNRLPVVSQSSPRRLPDVNQTSPGRLPELARACRRGGGQKGAKVLKSCPFCTFSKLFAFWLRKGKNGGISVQSSLFPFLASKSSPIPLRLQAFLPLGAESVIFAHLLISDQNLHFLELEC